jgi:hypothetical protein
MPDVDDGARRSFQAAASGADQEVRDRFDRFLRGREANAKQPTAAKCIEALKR